MVTEFDLNNLQVIAGRLIEKRSKLLQQEKELKNGLAKITKSLGDLTEEQLRNNQLIADAFAALHPNASKTKPAPAPVPATPAIPTKTI